MEKEIEKLKMRVNNLECAMRSALERIPHGIEEKKTLSDEIKLIFIDDDNEGTEICKRKDVKEALKEFIGCFTQIQVGYLHKEVMEAKAKKIFGERLI